MSNCLAFGSFPPLPYYICSQFFSQDIKTNQQECFRLAHRAAHLLTALGRRMEGKWDDAPESLLENIREFEV